MTVIIMYSLMPQLLFPHEHTHILTVEAPIKVGQLAAAETTFLE
jgi:hypothetical protein